MINDVTDPIDINPSSGDIRCHQRQDITGPKAVECPKAGPLRFISVDGSSR
jgi:hypothetical protein